MSGEAGNLFNNGGSNGFPSIQSGSWSALMQSAVAETSSGDVRPQEEWSGSHFNNINGSSANQQILPALSSRSIPPSDDVNKLNVMGLKQLGGKFQNEPGQPVPTDKPQRFGSALEEAKWSNNSPLQKTVAEDTQIYGNASQHSLYAERNAKTISTTWAPGQSGTRQQSNGWNALAAVSPDGHRASNVHEAEDLPQNSLNSQLRVMQAEVLHGSSLLKSNAVPSSAIEDPAKSTVGNQRSNDAIVSVASSYNMGVGDGTIPFVQGNYLPSQWKNAYPSTKQGVERLGRTLDQVNEHNHGLHLSNSCDKDEVTRRDMENRAMRENSSDSHRSNLSQHASSSFRESVSSGVNDSTSLLQGNQKSTNQLARRVPVPRRFQYHPMGNLDEDAEPTYGQQPTHVQAVSLQNTHFGQSQLFDQVPRNSTITDKGELQKDNKVPDQEPSRGSYPGHAPSVSVPFSRPSDSCGPNNASSPSQNMLELLHKVDQSRHHGAVTHLSPSECNVSSQLPDAEKFDGSAGRPQRSQSSVSQGFGLQLGPPSQRLHLSDHSSSSLYNTPGNHHPEFSSGNPYGISQLQANQITTLGGKKDQHINSSLSGNASRSIQGGSAQTVLPDASRDIQKDNLSSSRGMAQQTSPYDVQDGGSAATVSTRDHVHRSQHFRVPGIARQGASSQVLHGMWTNVPTSQHMLGDQYSKVPPHLTELPQPDVMEPNSQGNLDGRKGGNLSSKLSGIHVNSAGIVDGEEHSLKESAAQLVSSENIDSAQKMEESLGKASSIKNQLDDSPVNSASTQKDIEAFGRSLKPNNFSNEKYALLNQMRASRDAEIDPSIRASKRTKVPDSVLDACQVNLVAGQQNEDNVRDSLGQSSGALSEDSRMLSFPTSSGILQRNNSTNENVTSQDIVVASLHASQSNPSIDCSASLRVDHGQVSPQMAPSWFNQYGSFKNGQMLPMNNAHQGVSLRPGEPPFTLGRSSSVLDAPNVEKCTGAPVDACQAGITLRDSAPTSVANEHLSSSQSLQLNVTDQHQVILRPKKRKTAAFEFHPWYREISNGSQNISTLSVAEADWNRAANRLTEKVEDDAELIEDGTPLLRSKRRLILTTQLMQQLFSPPPATILSADASSAYESLTYAVSRVLLGDACGTVSHSSDLGLPGGGVNLHPIKGKLKGNPRFAKVTEELLEKARRLENDFLRLDKSTSILDLRVECQDLEKFSVINRFAKFHGRAQTDNADTASTEAMASMLKPCAQRYVTAVPMPRSLPERVQCLSL
ncbi:hypothetical protein CDL12_22391 [Handroanthus impetiginosus]|uniref:Uncharacterized protein n=1 Tax=Handroanthus impetiginosus TaxID=429701 RepID=A0A2G9GJ67_9LAMI|nr:hypothetical protein CDL12_22391 [Handroanthus impetiginosus]